MKTREIKNNGVPFIQKSGRSGQVEQGDPGREPRGSFKEEGWRRKLRKGQSLTGRKVG